MAIRGSRKWTRQPPNGFAEINGELPNPFAIFRTGLDRQQIFPDDLAVTSTYSSNASRSIHGELGMYITGGVTHTLTPAFPHRFAYAMAVRFQLLATGATQTIYSLNGNDNGTQVRITTSGALELLSEAAASLATSSSTPFTTSGRVHNVAVVCPGNGFSTYFYVDGRLVMTYAGAVDQKISFKNVYFGRRGGATDNNITATYLDAVMWCGVGNLPTLAEAQEISRDYYGTVYAPRNVGAFIGSVGGAATHTTTGDLVAGSATVSGAALHPHTTTGALEAGSATVSGSAVHPHTTAGALEAQAATVTGDADISAGAVTHTTTGTLAADAATVAGSATHLTLHDTSGDLVADSAAISGTAQNGTFVPTPQGGAGRSKRVRKRYQVEIDGETFDVGSPEEAKQVLETLRQAAEDKAAEAVQKAAESKRVRPHKVVRDARKDLVEPQIAAPPQFADMVSGVMQQVRSTYADALRTIEIAALLRQREIEDDDEEILLLL